MLEVLLLSSDLLLSFLRFLCAGFAFFGTAFGFFVADSLPALLSSDSLLLSAVARFRFFGAGFTFFAFAFPPPPPSASSPPQQPSAWPPFRYFAASSYVMKFFTSLTNGAPSTLKIQEGTARGGTGSGRRAGLLP